MRKAHEAPRFPESACLFRFCCEALQAQRGARIHDQDVGNILGYNPSDTSHWKRGKKAVRNIYALEKLAATVGVSSELIQDIADGLLSFDDAWFEFEEILDLRRIQSAMTAELRLERQVRLQALEQAAQGILGRSRIQTVPVFLPELIELFPYIKIAPGELPERIARSLRGKPGAYQIKHRKGDMNAHTRMAIGRELARIILLCERDKLGLPPRSEFLENAEIVAFSQALLVPKNLLRTEVQKHHVRLDLVGTLAEAFWVPRSAIRSRLKDLFIENLTKDEVLRAPVAVRTIEGAQRPAAYWGNSSGPSPLEDLAEDGSATGTHPTSNLETPPAAQAAASAALN